MEENNQTIIDIKIPDALIASLKLLRDEYVKNTEKLQEYDKQLKAGKISQEQYDKAVIEVTQNQKVLRQEISGVEKQMQNEIKSQKAQEGSLVQLRAQLANLNKQYDSMSGFERMGTAGEALRTKIKALSDNISNLESNTGRYQRNVGNYKSALEGLSGSFKMAGLSTKGLDQAMGLLSVSTKDLIGSFKVLFNNPIKLVFTAIVAVVRPVIQAFKGNEEATRALHQAFAAFNPIIDAAKRGLESLARVITKVVYGAVYGLTRAIGGLLTAVQEVGNFFGADWNMADNFIAARDAAEALTKSEQDYIDAKRKWSNESMKIDAKVSELREKASDKEDYNAQQRLAFLDEAIKLETEKAAKDKQMAEWNLRNLKAEADRSANSTEANEKLVEAENEVTRAEINLNNTKRNLNRQRQQAIREINGEASAVGNYTAKVKELRKELELIKALSIDELTEANTKKNKELADNIKQVVDRVGLLDETFEKLPSAEELFGDLADVTDENLKDTTTSFELFAEGFKNNAETIEQTASALSSSFGSVASMYETMAKDESKSEAEREKAARKAKTWAALQIAANSGTALAKGIAGAMDVPWPANIGALASIMATVLAAIAQAKALAAESHEHGGVIGGKFIGATRGGDDTYIHARRGELMLNADQQRQLYDIANGNTKTSMAAQLAEAIQAMPAPVLVYEEFSRFGQKIVNINELTQLQ